jgi:hypothetical protein
MDPAESQSAAPRTGDQIAEWLLELAAALGAVSLLACGALMLARHDGFPPPRSSPEWAVGYFGVGAALTLLVLRELWLWRQFVRTRDDAPAVIGWLALGVAVVALLKYPVPDGDIELIMLGAKLAMLIGVLVGYRMLRSEHRERLDRLLTTVILLFAVVTWWTLPL